MEFRNSEQARILNKCSSEIRSETPICYEDIGNCCINVLSVSDRSFLMIPYAPRSLTDPRETGLLSRKLPIDSLIDLVNPLYQCSSFQIQIHPLPSVSACFLLSAQMMKIAGVRVRARTDLSLSRKNEGAMVTRKEGAVSFSD